MSVLKEAGKKAAILISVLGMLGFSNAIADTKGERIEGSRPVESVDSIILENADKSKTLFFGESHWLSEDSDYVMHLLPKLKKLGFSYLGIEMIENPEETDKNRREFLKFIQDYKKNVPLNFKDYPGCPIGYVELTKAALDLGFEIVLFDVYDYKVGGYGTPRDTAMFNILKEKIFDKDINAKAIIYCGVWHCSEKPIYEPSTRKKEKTLSLFLEEYTEGRNYSIALRYEPIWEELILKEGKLKNPFGPPTTNKTSGKLSHAFDLDLSNHPLLEPYYEEFSDK